MVVCPLTRSEFEVPGGRPRRGRGREQGESGAVHPLSIHQRPQTGCMARTHAAHRGRHGNETHMDRQAETTSQEVCSETALTEGRDGGR